MSTRGCSRVTLTSKVPPVLGRCLVWTPASSPVRRHFRGMSGRETADHPWFLSSYRRRPTHANRVRPLSDLSTAGAAEAMGERTWSPWDSTVPLRFLHAEAEVRPLRTKASSVRRFGSLPETGGVLLEGAGSTGSEERRVGKECRSRWSPYH